MSHDCGFFIDRTHGRVHVEASDDGVVMFVSATDKAVLNLDRMEALQLSRALNTALLAMGAIDG